MFCSISVSDDMAKADRAEALLAAGGVISVQVLNEFVRPLRRAKRRSIFPRREKPFRPIRRACASQRHCDVDTHELGLDIAERYRFSIYDSLIVAAALRAGCSTLYSEDLQHGQTIERLTIRNPFTD